MAFQVGSHIYNYVDTVENQPTYQLDELPVGRYQVAAYKVDGRLAGGYIQAVTCGLSVECTDHVLTRVPVNSGQTVTSVDPGNWYAPEGAFPQAPVIP